MTFNFVRDTKMARLCNLAIPYKYVISDDHATHTFFMIAPFHFLWIFGSTNYKRRFLHQYPTFYPPVLIQYLLFFEVTISCFQNNG